MSDQDFLEQAAKRAERLEFLLKKKEKGLASEDDEIEIEILLGKSKQDTTAMIFGAIGGLAALIFFSFLFFGPDSAEEKQAKRQAADQKAASREAELNNPRVQARSAEWLCEQEIEKLLRDPDSARWLGASTDIRDGGLFLVTGRVAARNGFGGISDQSYECLFRLGNGNWYKLGAQLVK